MDYLYVTFAITSTAVLVLISSFLVSSIGEQRRRGKKREKRGLEEIGSLDY